VNSTILYFKDIIDPILRFEDQLWEPCFPYERGVNRTLYLLPERQKAKASALSGVVNLKERHGHDLEIKNQTPIFHVPDVVVNPLS
jgi:hypothetical protein